MKKSICFLFAALLSSFGILGAQCIDESLIDSNIICPAIWEPVCGCDGITYSNQCEAEAHGGVTSWTVGECTQISECLDLGEIDFGVCDMYLGIAYFNGQCIGLSGCGYVIDGVDYSPYFFENQEDCLTQCAQPCIDSSVIDSSMACVGFMPPYYVCGCDGETYPDSCVAYYYNGITSWTLGPCDIPTDVESVSDNGIFVYPNPVRNHLNIYSAKLQITTVRLYSLTGQLLSIKEINNDKTISKLDTSRLTQGIYTLVVSNLINETLAIFRVIKE